jgi:hypothetical protein
MATVVPAGLTQKRFGFELEMLSRETSFDYENGPSVTKLERSLSRAAVCHSNSGQNERGARMARREERA